MKILVGAAVVDMAEVQVVRCLLLSSHESGHGRGQVVDVIPMKVAY